MPSFSTHFTGHLVPSDDMIAGAMTTGLIVLDTNVLLGAYRFAAKAREELLSALEQARERLWIPHQVAHEFHKNRFSVIAEHDAAYKILLDSLHEHRKTIEAELETKVRELSNRVALADKERERLLSMARQALNPLQRAIDVLHNSHGLAEPTGHDPVLHRLERIFENRVGEPYDGDEQLKAEEEARRRVAENIPPGYKDAGKDDSSGDYFVWAQTLDEVARRRPPYLVFVTGDTKEDWYLRVKGKTIIGRPELTKECLAKTGARLIAMPTKSFLRYAREYLNADVSVETLQQAAKVSAQPDVVERRRRLDRRLAVIDSERNMLMAQARDIRMLAKRSEERKNFLRAQLIDLASEHNEGIKSQAYRELAQELEREDDRSHELSDRAANLHVRLGQLEAINGQVAAELNAALGGGNKRLHAPTSPDDPDL